MPSARDPEPLTPARCWLFRLSIVAIPLLFFVLLEAGLRLGGYGHSYPQFIAVADAPGYLQANQGVVRRFVVEETREPEVANWPYGFGASLAGMLQQRLQASLPQRNIEVIITAMMAVNSYTLMDFAAEKQ